MKATKGTTVGEKGNQSQPNVYERIDPAMRFTVLSEFILKRFGEKTEGNSHVQGPNTAVWPEKPQGYHFKLKKTLVPAFMYPATMHTLEHYVDELPDRPLTRYAVMSTPWQSSDIAVVDASNQPIPNDPRQGIEAAKQALTILTEAAGAEGWNLLNDLFDKRFEQLIGRYVLSDLAVTVEGAPVPAISEKHAEAALVEHLLHDIEICEEEADRSHETDSDAKQSFVSDAINEVPPPTRRGRYTQIDIFGTVKSASIQMRSGWMNTVEPNQ